MGSVKINGVLGNGEVFGSGGQLNSGLGLQNNLENKKPKVNFDLSKLSLPTFNEDQNGTKITDVVGDSDDGLKEALEAVQEGKATKIYFDSKTGRFVNHPASHMTFKDGKIQFDVAADVANAEWYQRIYQSDSFKNLAEAYKQNPSGNLELEYTEKDENGEDVKKKDTINTLLQRYADDLETFSKDYQGNIDIRTVFDEITGGNLDLTDDDVSVIANYNSISKDKHSNTDAIPLPVWAVEFFADNPGYDAVTDSISADAFYEFYDLDKELTEKERGIIDRYGGGYLISENDDRVRLKNGGWDGLEAVNDGMVQRTGESDKDYAIDLMREMSSQAMVEIMNQMVNMGHLETDEEKALMTREYVRNYSLYQLMTKDTPSTNAWTGFNLWVQSFSTGFTKDLPVILDNTINWFDSIILGIVEGGAGLVGGMGGVFHFTGDVIGNFFEGGPDLVNERFKSMGEYVTEDAYGLIEDMEGENTIVGDFKKNVEEGIEWSKNLENDAVQKALAANLRDLADTYANTEAAMRFGTMAAYAIQQILVTNVVGGAVGKAASTAFAHSNLAARMATSASFSSLLATMAVASGGAAEAALYLTAMNHLIQLGGWAIGGVANIFAQGVVDTFAENPDYADVFVFNGSTADVAKFQEELRWNVVWNSVGELVPFVGHVGKKGVKAFLNTDTGTLLQAVSRKFVNRFTLAGRQIYQGISSAATSRAKKIVVEQTASGKAIANANNKLYWQSLRKKTIEVQKKIKDTKIFRNEDGVLSGAKTVDDLIDERIKLENELSMSKKWMRMQTTKEILSRAGLHKESQEINTLTADLSKFSRKIGQTNLPGSFSRQTGDYMSDLYNLGRIRRKQKYLKSQGKSLSKQESTALKQLSERIKNYEASIPEQYLKEYKAAVKQYLKTSYKFFYKLNNFLSSAAGGYVLNPEYLEKVRKNSQFGKAGEMYMPLYAASGFKSAKEIEEFFSDPTQIIEVGKSVAEVKNFTRKSFSTDTVYFDPNYARDMYVAAYADVLNAATRGDVLKQVGPVAAIETDSKGKILKTSKEVKASKKALYDDLKNKFQKAFNENTQKLASGTVRSNKKKISTYYSKLKRDNQKIVDRVLGLDSRGLKAYADELSGDQINTIGQVYSLPAYTRRIRTRADLDAMYGSLSKAQQQIVDDTLEGAPLTLKNWNDAVDNCGLDHKLYKQYIKENKGILNSKLYKDMVADARIAEIEGEEALALRTAQAKIAEADAGAKLKRAEKDPNLQAFNAQKERDFKKVVRGTLNEAIEGTIQSLEDNPFLERLLKDYAKQGIAEEDAKRYIICQWLFDNSDKNGVVQEIARNYYSAPSKVTGERIAPDSAINYSKKFQKTAHSVLESRLNNYVRKLRGTPNGSKFIDLEATSKRVDRYLHDITGKWSNKQIVEIWNRKTGKFEYFQVDASTSMLVNYYPSFAKHNPFVVVAAKLNSIARMGQITLRAASLVTQGFKDTLNALILGDWRELFLDNPMGYKKIATAIGPDVVDAFRKEMTPEAWRDFLKGASAEGLTVEEAIAKSEINSEALRLKIEGGSSTREMFFAYRDLYTDKEAPEALAAQQIKATADTWTEETKKHWWNAQSKARERLVSMGQKVKGGANKLQDSANYLHNLRERNLRMQNYRQNFVDALNNGKSLAQAREYAQYVMDNATTKFSRGFAWGDSIIRCIPYFGAALNGASSFIRLLEIDPVGITVRFMTDLVVPTVALTAMSLSNERDAEIYRNIPEYERKGNINFVIDGQAYTIPLPEEMAKFLLPISHTIESIAGGNKNAWHELMMSDILNMPVVPLDAVMMLDEDKLVGDITIMDRISALAMDLFNTLSPNGARTAYILMEHRDPYTGRDYDNAKVFEDAEGGYQFVTESEYGFVNDLANLFKSWGWDVNAALAGGVLSSMFGTGSVDLMDGVRDFVAAAQAGKFKPDSLFEKTIDRMGNVLQGTTRTDERQAQIAWYDYINLKNTQKDELLAPSGELKRLSDDIDMAGDQKTYEEKKAKYDAIVRNWQNTIVDEIRDYISKYGEFYDRRKFAATLSLMNAQLNIDNLKDSTSYYAGKSEATKTFFDAGFDTPSDASIFGYVYRNPQTGIAEIKYTNPLVMSFTQNLFWYQGDDAKAAITNAMNFSGLSDEYKNTVFKKYLKAIKASDFAAANKIAEDWDVRVMQTIGPLIESYTVGDLLSKDEIIDYLDDYILVPNTKEAMGKGQYYSSKTGLDKKKGYAESYLKKLYKNWKEKNK